MELFRLWPAHIVAWYAFLIPASLLFAVRDTSPFRRSLAWVILGISTLAVGEFGIASLADAYETSRHLLIFHVYTDCTFFFALVFLASRLNSIARIESRPVLFAALAGLGVLGVLMGPRRSVSPPATSLPCGTSRLD